MQGAVVAGAASTTMVASTPPAVPGAAGPTRYGQLICPAFGGPPERQRVSYPRHTGAGVPIPAWWRCGGIPRTNGPVGRGRGRQLGQPVQARRTSRSRTMTCLTADSGR